MEEFVKRKDKQPELRDYDDFTWVPNIVFKSLGYDFLGTTKSRWQQWALRFYLALSTASHFYNSYYMFKRLIEWDAISENPKLIMRYAVLVSFVFNSNIKAVTFLTFRKRVNKVNEILKNIYPKSYKERADFCVNEFYWPRSMLSIIMIYFGVSALVVFGPLVQSSWIFMQDTIHLGITNATFPYLRCYPMEFGFSSIGFWNYMLTTWLEFTFSHFIVAVNVGTDLWVVCFVAQICMHMNFIGLKLTEYKPLVQNDRDNCQFLVILIKRHQLTLSLQKEVDNIFGVLLVYNLLSTAGTLCCVAYYTILQGMNLEALSYMFYFFSASAQFYMVCYYGQMMISLSENLSLAAYKHAWYNGSVRYKNMILLITTRSQKPAAISAWGYMAISLDTFKVLMFITYRFFALIRTMLK